ncbi:MAG TPA: hypothetical protein VGX03_03770 [Candidatus Binatia bacterium]|jgi:hypothetical protein|nr:hypothetical protein [Candidatus Binatia bacterium]
MAHATLGFDGRARVSGGQVLHAGRDHRDIVRMQEVAEERAHLALELFGRVTQQGDDLLIDPAGALLAQVVDIDQIGHRLGDALAQLLAEFQGTLRVRAGGDIPGDAQNGPLLGQGEGIHFEGAALARGVRGLDPDAGHRLAPGQLGKRLL